MRTVYLIANWKLYLSVQESLRLARLLARQRKAGATIIVCPSMVALHAVGDVLRHSAVQLGAQDVSSRTVPMSTGDTTASELATLGCSSVLVGHSERRALGESNALVNQKLHRISEAGMIPLLCIGETRKIREAQAQRFVRVQLRESTRRWSGKTLFLVYEPVWAISKQGQGASCPPEQAKSMARFLRQEAKNLLPKTRMVMIYGGSAKSANIGDFVDGKTFQGALPGFASTKLSELKAMAAAIS